MALNRAEKAAAIEEISAQVAKSQVIVLAEYRGLEVGQITALRKQARGSGVYLRVLKNTLARRAVAGTPYEQLADKMSGPLMYGMSSDPVSAAKVLDAFASKPTTSSPSKRVPCPTAFLTLRVVKALASLPSRDELLGKLLGTMQAPVSKFVQTLNEVPTKFVRALAAVRDQKETSGA